MFRRMMVVVPLLLSATTGCKVLVADGTDGSGASEGVGGDGSVHSGGTGGDWGNVGAGGSGGWPAIEYPTGGQGGFAGALIEGWGGEGSERFEVVTVEEGDEIVDIAVTETHVYWLTYGTTNLVLGKYNLDGALHRRAIDGGDIEIVLDGIEGPERVEVTSTHAYVWLEKSTPLTKHEGLYFGRVSVEGDEQLESVEHGELPPMFFDRFEDRAYFHERHGDVEGVYEHVAGEEPRLILEIDAYDLMTFRVDSSYLYYANLQGGLLRVSLDGGSPQLLWEGLVSFDLAPAVSKLVGVLTDGLPLEMKVVTMPSSGGEWELITKFPLANGQGYYEPEAAGDRWLLSSDARAYSTELLQRTGLFDGSDVAELPDILADTWMWALTEHDVFRAQQDSLVRIPLD